MLFRIIVLASVFFIASCSSALPAPKMQYYLLDLAPSQTSNEPQVQIAQVRVTSMPDYLNQSSLVMMVDTHKMEMARYHSWADRLNDSVARIVQYEYNKRLTESGYNEACEQCYRIALSIEHFYPTSDGDVYLAGYYQYETEQKEVVKQRFNLAGTMQADGYQAAVEEMRRLLVMLSERIAVDAAP